MSDQGQQVRLARTVIIDGKTLSKTIEDFKPPTVKKKMIDKQGGSMMTGKQFAGLEPMDDGSLQVAGALVETLNLYGVEMGGAVSLIVIDSFMDEKNNQFTVTYDLNIEITEMPESGSKVSEKQIIDIKYVADAYKKTIGDKIVYDIDLDMPKCDLGKGDLYAQHRAATRMGG